MSLKFVITVLTFFLIVMLTGFFLKINYKNAPSETLETKTTEFSKTDSTEEILMVLKNSGLNCSLANGSEKGVCSINKLQGKFAKGTMAEGWWIGLNSETGWRVILSGNGIPECGEVDKYQITRDIYGNCIEAGGELRY